MNQRLIGSLGALIVTITIAMPAFPQGKSQEPHGNGGKSNSADTGNKGGKSGSADVTPPSVVSVATPASVSTSAPATPFAWIDNAALMSPGTMWIGLSTTRWQYGGFSETSFPVVDAAVGVSSRLQIGASVPHVQANDQFIGEQGGAGTTFLNGKIALLNDPSRHLKVAVTPTLEILSQAAMLWMPPDTNRVQWGLPASVEFERGSSRVYGSAGHFSPRIWYTGGGGGAQLTPKLTGTLSISRAWSTSSTPSAAPLSARHDVSLGLAYDVTPNVGIFGSLGRTFKTAAQFGAGTSVSAGVSLTASKAIFTQ